MARMAPPKRRAGLVAEALEAALTALRALEQVDQASLATEVAERLASATIALGSSARLLVAHDSAQSVARLSMSATLTSLPPHSRRSGVRSRGLALTCPPVPGTDVEEAAAVPEFHRGDVQGAQQNLDRHRAGGGGHGDPHEVGRLLGAGLLGAAGHQASPVTTVRPTSLVPVTKPLLSMRLHRCQSTEIRPWCSWFMISSHRNSVLNATPK